MKRPVVFLAVIVLAFGTAARAGELDEEFGAKAKASPSTPSAVAPVMTGTELDGETPAQACFFGWRRPFFGFGGFGYGYPGFGYGFGRFGYGFGYPGFGFGGFGWGRGFGGFGWGRGFGGYGFHRGRW